MGQGHPNRDRGRLREEELPDRVRFRSWRSSGIEFAGAARWAKGCIGLLVVAAPIAFVFGVPAGVCVVYPLGTCVLLCLVMAAQALALRGLVIFEPRTVDILTDAGGDRAGPAGAVMRVDGYPVARGERTELQISHHAGAGHLDEDTFTADLVTRRMFIELDTFETAAGAQALAKKIHARLSDQQATPTLDLTPRPAAPLPQAPLLLVILLWALLFGPASLGIPILVWPGADAAWNQALLGLATGAAVVGVELLVAVLFYRWLGARSRLFLKRRYGIPTAGGSGVRPADGL
jgi:hypothetical protein